MFAGTVVFGLIALIADFFAFGGFAVATGIAKILFLIFLIVFTFSLIIGLVRSAESKSGSF